MLFIKYFVFFVAAEGTMISGKNTTQDHINIFFSIQTHNRGGCLSFYEPPVEPLFQKLPCTVIDKCITLKVNTGLLNIGVINYITGDGDGGLEIFNFVRATGRNKKNLTRF